MNKFLLFLLLIASEFCLSTDSYYHFGKPDKPNYFRQDDPFGINQPFVFESKPENLDPYQNPWRPTAPIKRVPTNDQETIQFYNISNPGVIRNW